jgi:Na+/citrate or Na+/malate symporter
MKHTLLFKSKLLTLLSLNLETEKKTQHHKKLKLSLKHLLKSSLKKLVLLMIAPLLKNYTKLPQKLLMPLMMLLKREKLFHKLLM